MSDVIVRLKVGGDVFDVEKSVLLSVRDTYFYAMLSSGSWQPDADGAYSIDRPAVGFDRILEYLSSGILTLAGLTHLEEECVYDNLNYFLIPPPWHSIDVSGMNLIDEAKAGHDHEIRALLARGEDLMVTDTQVSLPLVFSSIVLATLHCSNSHCDV